MEASPKKRNIFIAGGVFSVLIVSGLAAFLYKSNYFNSCEGDLKALISVYSDANKTTSLLEDSSYARNLFASLESQECKSNVKYDGLYKELLSGIRAMNSSKSSVQPKELPQVPEKAIDQVVPEQAVDQAIPEQAVDQAVPEQAIDQVEAVNSPKSSVQPQVLPPVPEQAMDQVE